MWNIWMVGAGFASICREAALKKVARCETSGFAEKISRVEDARRYRIPFSSGASSTRQFIFQTHSRRFTSGDLLNAPSAQLERSWLRRLHSRSARLRNEISGSVPLDILCAESHYRGDDQREKHEQEDQRIDQPVSPRMQETHVVTQVLGKFFGAFDIGHRLQFRHGGLSSFAACF